MTINWNRLTTPDIAGALNAGMQNGREMKRQQTVQSALAAFAQNPSDTASTDALIAADPALGFRLQDRQREQQRVEARRAVFAPPPTVASPTAGMVSDGAPTALVDPSQLPPRTDGLQINQEALRNLYQIDPDGALEVQKTIYSADAAGAKRLKESGETMATAAYRLSKLPPDQRAAELRAMAPQLVSLGVDPQMIASADTSDASLDRYMTLGRSISEVMKEDDAKYVVVPKEGDLVNVRDPKAVSAFMGGAASAPAGAVEMLRKNPGLAEKFDQKYGAGASRQYLGGPTPSASGTFPGR